MNDNIKLINFSKVVDVLFDLCFICCHRTTVNLQMTSTPATKKNNKFDSTRLDPTGMSGKSQSI